MLGSVLQRASESFAHESESAVPAKILVVDDDPISLIYIRRIVQKAGYEVRSATNGVEALKMARDEKYDAILTDWMMPEMDGIELVRHVRTGSTFSPFIAIVTAIASEEARLRALESGADDYLTKPYRQEEIEDILTRGLRRGASPRPSLRGSAPASTPSGVSLALGIAASTGGPPTVRTVVRDLQVLDDVAVFVVLHAPAWMLEGYAQRLGSSSDMPVVLGTQGAPISAGTVYLAPGDHHMTVSDGGQTIQLDKGPPENYLRPAADPLFRSLARVYKDRCLSVVLTGMGKDGTIGAGHVSAAGGGVIVQDPSTAIVASMPKSVLDMRIAHKVVSLDRMGQVIIEELSRMHRAVATGGRRSQGPVFMPYR